MRFKFDVRMPKLIPGNNTVAAVTALCAAAAFMNDLLVIFIYDSFSISLCYTSVWPNVMFKDSNDVNFFSFICNAFSVSSLGVSVTRIMTS